MIEYIYIYIYIYIRIAEGEKKKRERNVHNLYFCANKKTKKIYLWSFFHDNKWAAIKKL